MWWKLQRQSVRAVPAVQQLHLCRESRADRSRGHRRCAHPRQRGTHNLLHTQVSGVDLTRTTVFLMELTKPPPVTCRMLKAKQQRQQSTPHQYWRVQPRVWPLSRPSQAPTGLTGARTTAERDGSTHGGVPDRLLEDNSSSFLRFPNSVQFWKSYNLSTHAVVGGSWVKPSTTASHIWITFQMLCIARKRYL